ncbi:MAG: glucans biosynthesis glucosyltransferase MdoH [Methylobacteriaceae bacterium]|nr:glucans biosynthesis glucosyltransferase MdoH [Methylobacteriaceae bacterium]
MLDQPSVRPGRAAECTRTLTRRRAIFAFVVAANIAGLLWLASIAVPPRSFGAILFVALFAISLPWTVVGFCNAVIGFVVMRLCRDPVATVNPLAKNSSGDEPLTASTAILMCIRNESPDQVIRNLEPLLDGIARARAHPLFHAYLLSDSSDPEIIAAEALRFEAFEKKWKSTIPITYRRRAVNTGFKSGNMRDFCERWGADHEFAVTLDADSFMPAHAVLRLVRIMQANPRLGILQTLIVGLPSVSPFARVFQFGMRLGMRSHTLGAAWWQGDCGPYWGHNAILRLAPFTKHCAMPVLPGKGPLAGHVLSHDQVEAALMRRAGYEVRVLPEEGLSFEENPPTLLEFKRRDLRWLHGNMQYWRLVTAPGLRPVSRFQLLFAMLMYLSSPAWIAMMAIGTMSLALSGARVGPAMPVNFGAGASLFGLVMFMTFAPKIASVVDLLLHEPARRSYGGAASFVANVATETLHMLILSPIMALAHTLFLVRLLVFRRGGSWNSQLRESHAVPWRLAMTRLWPQTLAGCIIIGVFMMKAPDRIALAFMGAGGLLVAIPFAVTTASPLLGVVLARIGIGRIPEEVDVPAALESLRLPAIEARGRNPRMAYLIRDA